MAKGRAVGKKTGEGVGLCGPISPSSLKRVKAQHGSFKLAAESR